MLLERIKAGIRLLTRVAVREPWRGAREGGSRELCPNDKCRVWGSDSRIRQVGFAAWHAVFNDGAIVGS